MPNGQAVRTCPTCGRLICPPPADLTATAGEPQQDPLYRIAEDDSAPGAPMAPPSTDAIAEPSLPRTCPVCGLDNAAEALVCVRCRASLRRKHWDFGEAPAWTSAGRGSRVNRRHLITALLSLTSVALVVVVLWMAGSLLRGLESPGLAYKRMTGMAAHGDWERYFDRLHPRTQAGVVALMRASGQPQPAEDKALFVSRMKADPDLLITLPYKDVTIEQEEVSDDVAWVHISSAREGRQLIQMSRHDGLWKARVPSLER